eukprot:IDg15048t1
MRDTPDGEDLGGEGELFFGQASEMFAALPTNEGKLTTGAVEDSRFPATKVKWARLTRENAKKTVRKIASRPAPSATDKSGSVSLDVAILSSDEAVAVATTSEALSTKSLKVKTKRAIVKSSEDDDLQETIKEALARIDAPFQEAVLCFGSRSILERPVRRTRFESLPGLLRTGLRLNTNARRSRIEREPR